MTLYSEAEPFHVPTRAQEVFDVTGAGDTVVAALAVALGGGMTLRDAVQLANAAAGIVVGKVGTAAVSLAELEAGFS
jgi:D-beta-D-heptose 7-phosphate kinase/D-beta-D-heptose 1-phosphate adenosyltransferase